MDTTTTTFDDFLNGLWQAILSYLGTFLTTLLTGLLNSIIEPQK
jgi:hypothetical protein